MCCRKFTTLIIVLSAVTAALGIYLLSNRFSAAVVWNQNEGGANSSSAFIYFSQLDGTGVSTSATVWPNVVGVMVDNHPDAWPLSGLATARVVYETPAEGDITRYLALFNSVQAVAEVGPVRSARPYFLDWLREYGDALYLHSGGSPAALNLIKELEIFDANEFWYGSFYWRDERRTAPHNLYTSGDNWRKIFDYYGAKRSPMPWQGWLFGDLSSSTPSEEVKEIKIKYWSDYSVSWRLTPAGNYQRLIKGQEMVDDGGQAVQADTIVVQFVSTRILDEIGRQELETVGNGEARVLRQGKMIRGRWKKDGATARTRFYDESGNEIPFAAGQIWVQIAPNTATLEVTN